MKIIGKNGMAMISGTIGEPDCKYVGTSGTFLVKFGVRTSNDKIDGQWKSEYTNVDCWGEVAECCRDLQKGDTVFVCGTESIREYNGKTYTTVKADFIMTMTNNTSAYVERMGDGISSPAGTSQFTEIDDDDGELPF